MRRAGTVAILAVAVGKLWLAARWGLLADEAYHWAWSRQLDWGYYDQPPLIAWVLALARALGGDHALVLRALPIGAWALAVWALLPHAREADTWLWWALGLPSLAMLTLFAVPDSLLLAAWAGALAFALRGGRGWWLAGLLGGLASLSKYSGIAVMPLLLLGATPEERRSPHPWIGLGLALALLLPNLAWNAQNDLVTFRFLWAHGLQHPRPPGLWGPVRFCLDQLLLLGPFSVLAALGWAWTRRATPDRVDRLCLATSLPLLAAFLLASPGAPPEAHWPAPAYIGLGLGLARATGRIGRLAQLGAVLWGMATMLLVLHAERPLVPLPNDPGARLTEGWHLADEVGRFVLPSAAGGEPRLPIYTERYQEAALLSWHGLEASVLPGCGRRSQYDLWAEQGGEPAARAWFVRPSRSRPPGCVLERYAPRLPSVVGTVDRRGRRVGPWDVIELEGRP